MKKSKSYGKASRKISPSKSVLVVLVIVVAVCLGVIAVYAMRQSDQTTNGADKPSSKPNSSDTNSSASNSQSSNSPSSNNNSSSQPAKELPKESTGGNLITPSGNFVSNHNPSLQNGYNSESSVCNTSPGAICFITFTSDGGATKSLPEKTTDSTGAAYWSWKLQDIGIGEGTWKVTATAKTSSDNKTSSDAIPLRVSP